MSRNNGSLVLQSKGEIKNENNIKYGFYTMRLYYDI